MFADDSSPKYIILLKGKARHGKDSVAQYLQDRYGFWRGSHAEVLKQAARYMGWDGVKDSDGGRGRRFLQHLGDVAREYDELILVKHVLEKIRAAGWPNRIVISDCRFPAEVNYYKNAQFRALGYQTFLVNVVRPGFDSDTHLGENAEHPSEKALDNIPADITLINDGETLDPLYNKVDIFCRQTLGIPPAPDFRAKQDIPNEEEEILSGHEGRSL